MLERGHARLEAPSCMVECYIEGVLLLPHSLPQAQEKGGSGRSLGTDDMPGPGLMLGAWCQVSDDHLYSLQFLILGRDRAHLIGDLVAFHWNILPFHTAGEKERSSGLRRWLSLERLPCKHEYRSLDHQHPGKKKKKKKAATTSITAEGCDTTLFLKLWKRLCLLLAE